MVPRLIDGCRYIATVYKEYCDDDTDSADDAAHDGNLGDQMYHYHDHDDVYDEKATAVPSTTTSERQAKGLNFLSITFTEELLEF